MGLFKDFKDDFTQAVNELVPGGDMPGEAGADNLVVDTLGEDVDVKKELSKLDGLLEQVKENVATADTNEKAGDKLFTADNKSKEDKKSDEKQADKAAEKKEDKLFTKPDTKPVEKKEEKKEEKVAEKPLEKPIEKQEEKKEETKPMNDMPLTTPVEEVKTEEKPVISDETSVITASTTLSGDISSSGSFDIQGTINGNVTCNGKIVVTGAINGNSSASEFFADVAKIEGEVASTGTVKIGAGSVIIGNISAASAVIAGAVKGDIDVKGPVVVDTSAVIMGNIKSRSVQINNGAVIEGFCSQCYADIDVKGLFDKK